MGDSVGDGLIHYPEPGPEALAAANGMTTKDFERQTVVAFALPVAAMVGLVENDWREAADRFMAQIAEDGWEIRRRG